MMEALHQRLSPEEQADPQFAYRVAFVPKVVNRATTPDLAVEFVTPRLGGSRRDQQGFAKRG